jgi:uncharacterized alkaline shock family protein YloU
VKDMKRIPPKSQRQSSFRSPRGLGGLWLERSATLLATSTSLGKIVIADEVIATIAGLAATECYGIVGMAARRFKDGIAELLGRENLSRGVVVASRDGGVSIDLNVIIGYGTRISEVAHNVSSQVKYRVEQSTGMRVRGVNISVQGVRAISER